MASVAPLDCQNKSLNLLTSKCSQNIPEAPPTARCKVAQRKMYSPRLVHFFFSTIHLRVKTICSCHPFMVTVTICFMCITTVSECYRLSFIVQSVCLKIVFCTFYAYNQNYGNVIGPFSSILNCWFHSCFLFALSLKLKNSRNSSIVLRAMRITVASISCLRKKGKIKCLLKTEQTSHQEGSQTKANICWNTFYFLWLNWNLYSSVVSFLVNQEIQQQRKSLEQVHCSRKCAKKCDVIRKISFE